MICTIVKVLVCTKWDPTSLVQWIGLIWRYLPKEPSITISDLNNRPLRHGIQNMNAYASRHVPHPVPCDCGCVDRSMNRPTLSEHSVRMQERAAHPEAWGLLVFGLTAVENLQILDRLPNLTGYGQFSIGPRPFGCHNHVVPQMLQRDSVNGSAPMYNTSGHALEWIQGMQPAGELVA